MSSALRFRTGFYIVEIRSICQGLPHKRTAYRLAVILLRANRNLQRNQPHDQLNFWNAPCLHPLRSALYQAFLSIQNTARRIRSWLRLVRQAILDQSVGGILLLAGTNSKRNSIFAYLAVYRADTTYKMPNSRDLLLLDLEFHSQIAVHIHQSWLVMSLLLDNATQ